MPMFMPKYTKFLFNSVPVLRNFDNRYLSMLIMHPFSDENECGPDGTNDCHQNANCTNTIGSYICTCNTGYSGDGKLCEGRNHNLMEEISRSSHLFLQI